MPDLGDAKPTTLDEVFAEIKKNMPPEATEQFKKDKQYSHHGIGQYLRNSWGLWADHEKPAPNGLVAFFWSIGVYMADDMSGIIFDSFHKHMWGEPINLRAQLVKYRNHWAGCLKEPSKSYKVVDGKAVESESDDSYTRMLVTKLDEALAGKLPDEDTRTDQDKQVDGAMVSVMKEVYGGKKPE